MPLLLLFYFIAARSCFLLTQINETNKIEQQNLTQIVENFSQDLAQVIIKLDQSDEAYAMNLAKKIALSHLSIFFDELSNIAFLMIVFCHIYMTVRFFYQNRFLRYYFLHNFPARAPPLVC